MIGIADALGHRANQLVLAQDADAHGVDERIALVRRIEHDFTGDSRHADAVAVVADAADDAREQIPDACGVRATRSGAELSIAMGRAPIVNTSRRMPPTPVAAP